MSSRSLTRRRTLIWPLLCVMALFPCVADGQPRSVSGTVFDRGGQPVEGAAVKLKNAITLQVRSYITQHDGYYRFYGLHPDMDYSVRARRDGRSSKSQAITRFDSKESVRIDLRLDLETPDRGQ